MPAWLALLRTHTRLWDEVESQMRQHDALTMPRYDVLIHLDMAGGRLGLSELASSILLSPSGLSKLLDRMEASELIRREPDPRDARSTFATITAAGRGQLRKARRHHHAWLQAAFGDVLDDEDVADLIRIMGRLAARIPGSGNG
jgi:DNA-binding MarR family transcriptional regulator